MLKRLVYHLLERRHYWRYVDFAELAELYASRTLRVLAVSMVAVFVAIYLYQNGYHLSYIMGYFMLYYVLRALMSFPSAFVVARIGPKHATLISNLLYVPALLAISQLDVLGIVALAVCAVFQSLSVSLYEVSYLVNFSKVKKDDHVGKELGFMYLLERVATGISPVVGGLIAYYFGVQATMYFAALLFALAALPLFFTGEPVRTHQLITFRQFNWRQTYKGLYANAAVGVDFVASGPLWALFIAVSIFGTASDSVYAKVGALASVTILASLIFSRIYGILIDRRRGGELLKYGVMCNSVIHIFRPLVTTPVGILLTNISNESATTAYAMPFSKGMFDMADSLPGYRIVYMTVQSIAVSFGAALMALIVGLLSLILNETQAMQVGFIVAAPMVLVILNHGFPALRPQRFI